ncbi:hypothetical protein [Spongiactinospora sp. TRM90649]|uniref:hypothetical protein n=1 Tax=Spongiactinospora sp. TRM90649 TaxID=3031114 RepID=UPI0023F9243B|nr:hypothetical protein [Spongiactinospora sp. TRM90649]MDF5756413.1 hypothetical protein [Spongiactinospora sp. TRM90649]
MSHTASQRPVAHAALDDLAGIPPADIPFGHADQAAGHRTTGPEDGTRKPSGSTRCGEAFFVVLAISLLVFFGTLRVLGVPDDEIVQLALWSLGISAAAIYGRSALMAIGRNVLNGIARESDK